MKKKPNLIILGAQKCGSTSLAYYLGQHPDIYLLPQEGHFFSKNSWENNIDNYLNLFSNRQERYIGEKTPHYFHHPSACKRIKKFCNNDVKFIVILRNPVDRAYSAYYWWSGKGKIDYKNFEECINAKITRMGIKGIGKYISHLKKWYKLYPKECILCLKTEDLDNNPQQVLNKVCDFLSLPYFIPKYMGRKKVQKYKPMNIRIRKILEEYYKPYNEKLYQEIGITW
jgi:hypothetical protein